MGIVKEKIKDLKTREARILEMGGEKLVAKHKEKGKLTARERLNKLFDKGTFREVDMFVKHRCVNFGMEDVEIGTGIAFPFGSVPAAVKAFEVEDAVRRGCTAVDMVMNIGALKSGDHQVVAEELRLFKQAAAGAVTKCILEVCFLADEEIATASKLVAEAGIDFVKTSSGQFEGPSLEQFLVMREAVRDAPVRLKVAGVKFPRPQNALVFLRAGADRIGTRAGPEIVDSLHTSNPKPAIAWLERQPVDELHQAGDRFGTGEVGDVDALEELHHDERGAVVAAHVGDLDDVLVNPGEGLVTGPDGSEHLPPKAMEVLLCLASRSGRPGAPPLPSSLRYAAIRPASASVPTRSGRLAVG